MNYEQAKGKQCTPEETVERIKKCLSDVGISVSDIMHKGDVEDTYYCRVSVDGTYDLIATNGKGMTEDYCRASGYAELMERIQNMCFQYCLPENKYLEIISEPENDGSCIRICTFPELLDLDEGFTREYMRSEARKLEGLSPLAANMTVAKLMRKACTAFDLDQIPILKVWDYKTKKYVWAPYILMFNTSLSNGMAAGNTLEEAIVQGSSEIFERHVQHELITNSITPPDIPEDVLKTIPGVYRIIQRIRETGQYDVIVKDCSLGKGYPVVCGIITDKKNQTFGVKFGSSPSMAIALERVFTEAMQGNTLKSFTKLCRVGFDKKYESNPENLFNVDKVGYGYYPVELFSPKPDYEFVPWEDVRNSNNASLAKKMLDKISENCSRLYIEDVSCLGFPSVFIFAQDFGNIHEFDLKREGLRNDAGIAMRKIGHANDEELEKVVRCAKNLKGSILENNINILYNTRPFTDKPRGGSYSLFVTAAMCLIKLKRYNEAVQWLAGIEADDRYDTQYVCALRSYAAGLATGTDTETLKGFLSTTVDEKVLNQIYEDFFENENTLDHVYGTCDRGNCEECTNDCLQPYFNEIFAKILRKLRDSGCLTAHLHEIFSE